MVFMVVSCAGAACKVQAVREPGQGAGLAPRWWCALDPGSAHGTRVGGRTDAARRGGGAKPQAWIDQVGRSREVRVTNPQTAPLVRARAVPPRRRAVLFEGSPWQLRSERRRQYELPLTGA